MTAKNELTPARQENVVVYKAFCPEHPNNQEIAQISWKLDERRPTVSVTECKEVVWIHCDSCGVDFGPDDESEVREHSGHEHHPVYCNTRYVIEVLRAYGPGFQVR